MLLCRRFSMRAALFFLTLTLGPHQLCKAQGQWDSSFGAPGTNGSGIWDLVEYNGGMVACGDFTIAGGVACSGVAFWDGAAWHPLGSGVTGRLGLACRVAVVGPDLYVGGDFEAAGGVPGTGNLARWDGSIWHSVGGGLNHRVYALHNFGGHLVVGGEFTRAGEVSASYIALWDGQVWHPLGTGFTQAIHVTPTVWSLETYGGSLIAGGRFTHAGGTLLNGIARWDGEQWQPLGTGITWGGVAANVMDMTVYQGDLIIGGQFSTAGEFTADGLARWDGACWHPMTPSTGWTEVWATDLYKGMLVVGGSFPGNAVVPARLALWDGSEWTGFGTAPSGTVDDVLPRGDDLFVGGYFSAIGDLPASHIARWVGWGLHVADVPGDQGGFLRVSWRAHTSDAVGAAPMVSYYELQRHSGAWCLEALVYAAQADTYEVTIGTQDILVIGEVPPTTQYRVIARTTDPQTNYTCLPVIAYSTDDLPPSAPSLAVYDTTAARILVWDNPTQDDLRETCLFRGEEPSFVEGSPLLCSPTEFLYQEGHLLRYYYRARSFDIHGNASEWSNEVVGRYPTGVPGVPAELRLYPCKPNPFNPSTMTRFDLPEAGPVHLGIYDVRGRLVRTLVEGSLPAGSHQATWDGRESAGRAVSSGIYFARLEAAGKVETVRMGLVR